MLKVDMLSRELTVQESALPTRFQAISILPFFECQLGLSCDEYDDGIHVDMMMNGEARILVGWRYEQV
jgi:hypothetical protein